MKTEQEKQIPILFHKIRNDAAHKYEEEKVRSILWSCAKKLHTNSPIRRIEVGINNSKNSAGYIKSFTVMVAVELSSGPRFVAHENSNIAKSKGVGLTTALRKAFSDIEAQYRKLKRTRLGK